MWVLKRYGMEFYRQFSPSFPGSGIAENDGSQRYNFYRQEKMFDYRFALCFQHVLWCRTF